MSDKNKLDLILDAFDRLADDDTEAAHVQADLLLLRALVELAGEAGEAVVGRWKQAEEEHGGWWYS